jgi:hypothetical protein
MKTIIKHYSIARLARIGMVLLFAAVVGSCGGGGGCAGIVNGVNTCAGTSPGGGTVPGGTTSTTSGSMSITLVNSSGVATNAVTTSGPLTVRATVLDGSGAPIANTIVTFASDSNLTTLTPSAGTALTNASGVATISLSPKDLNTAQLQAGAAGIVSAAVTVGTQAIIATTPFIMGSSAITLSLVTPSPSTINLNAYDTTPIKVDVLANGSLYTAQPVTVNFTSACANSGKAILPTSTATVNGRAQVVYADKGCGGTDTVTVSVAGAPSVTANLVIASPVASSIKFASATPSDKAIVITGAGGIGRTETALLTFQALDTAGNPLPNTLVTFTVISTNPVFLQTSSATTDSNGQVVAIVKSGASPTTFRVNATLAGGVTTISDTITVTTGQPVQAAFSLSAETFNIEGWSHDNEKTKINILLADISGNPVADGTPIVFQTDSGAIGSSDIGGCITTNGGCSVDFRSQNPRFGVGNSAGKRAGLATINVSTTTALVTLSGQIGVFLSGSSAVNVYSLPTNSQMSSTATNAFSTSGCGNASIRLELNDINFNPLPVGSTITAQNADFVTVGTILPAAVPNIGPHDSSGNGTLTVANLAARQGSVHTIPVKPDPTTCDATGTNTAVGTFDIVITTPLGVGVQYSFSLTYPVL